MKQEAIKGQIYDAFLEFKHSINGLHKEQKKLFQKAIADVQKIAIENIINTIE